MDALLAEINKRKRGGAGAGGGGARKRYVRRGEAEEEKRRAEEEAAAAVAADASAPPAKRARTARAREADEEGGDGEEAAALPEEAETKRALRAMGRPVTLFGEGAAERYARWKELQLMYHDRAHGSAGKGNAYRAILEQEVADEIRRAAEKEAAAEEAGADTGQAPAAGAPSSDAPGSGPAAPAADKYLAPRARDQCESDEEFCLYWLKRMLALWDLDLQARPDAEKRSYGGQNASATQKQTRQSMKPMFRKLKQRTMAADFLGHLTDIVRLCSESRDYMAANEAYVRIAIGESQWPIGAVQVGIHSRASHDKLRTGGDAHALADEQTRKYVQGIRRLVTYAQSKWPNADPSRNMG